MEYPKIHTIWKRDENTHKVIVGEYSREEFKSINRWTVTEKVDGTNIRVYWSPKDEWHPISGGEPHFAGKTDNAQIPTPLLTYLTETFTEQKFREGVFSQNPELGKIILYGEGYGPHIQKGGSYRDTVSFALFDIYIDGWWLERVKVEEIAKTLGIETVPSFGVYSTQEAIDRIQKYVPSIELDITSKYSPLRSVIAQKSGCPMEGIVAKSFPLVLFRDGTPVAWKLKIRDFL